MKIALFGANGMIGQRILAEALSRGHQVTALVRNPDKFDKTSPGLEVVAGDVLDEASVATVAAGHDVVISAVGPGADDAPEMLVAAAQALIRGCKRAGVRRILVVGGAGSLEVASGVLLMDTPTFPDAWKRVAQAHRAALNSYRAADIDWTFISPAGTISPGERTGHYRTGTDQLLTDANGESRISAEDYAAALLDEVENAKHNRQRITFAY